MDCIINKKKERLKDELVTLSLYSYGVYTSFVIQEGKVKGWKHHLQRVSNDANEFLGLNVDQANIVDSVSEYIKQFGGNDNLSCRVTISPRDFGLGDPQNASDPLILVTGRPGSSVVDKPLNLKIIECGRPFAQNKNTNIGPAIRSRALVKLDGFDDALFSDGSEITEGPTWNVFFIKRNRIFTPKLTGNLLPGVTRKLIIDSQNKNVEERYISTDEYKDFDAAFVTNSVIGVRVVASIDGFSLDVKHPLINQILEDYQNIASDKVNSSIL